jgi:pilus assembly protein CpaE
MSAPDLTNAPKTDSDGIRFVRNWRVFCVCSDPGILEQALAAVRGCLASSSVLEVPKYPETSELERLLGGKSPSILLLDVISNSERALALIPEILKTSPGAHIIALLNGSEPQMILRCLRQGASEFMVLPFSGQQFETSLNKIARTVPKEQPLHAGKIFCVASAKGACGASTLATNLAFHARRSGAERVLLADLDPLTGTISFLLKMQPTYSFMDVLAHMESLDLDLWKAMVATRLGVDVLFSPETLVDGAEELRDATQLVEFARLNYDVVILDCASVYGDWNLSQAKLCDELVLTTSNELPALQATQRALAYLEANRVGNWKVRVVVNRYDKGMGLTRDVIGTALRTDVYHVLPTDYEAVQKSLLEGKAVAPSSSLGKSLSTLGDRLLGKVKAAPVKSGGSSFGSLLSLFTRTSS